MRGALRAMTGRGGSRASNPKLSVRAAIRLGSLLRMTEYRVVGVSIDPGPDVAGDPHVVTLCLDDGRRVTRARAISNLRYGVEAYYAETGGTPARLRVVDPCSRCGRAY